MGKYIACIFLVITIVLFAINVLAIVKCLIFYPALEEVDTYLAIGSFFIAVLFGVFTLMALPSKDKIRLSE